jgi:hypothetical protein
MKWQTKSGIKTKKKGPKEMKRQTKSGIKTKKSP